MSDPRPKLLITGTSRGLGRALACRLVDSHDIIGVARGQPAPPFESPSIDHRSGVDLTSRQDIEALVADLGVCDALIHNAGVGNDGLLATQGEAQIHAVVQLNLTAVLILTKLYIRERLAMGRSGNVISIGSVAAHRGFKGLSAYGATKASLAAMNRSLAREMGKKGFRFNLVVPGFIETEMSRSLSRDQRQRLIRRTPLGRLGTVDDIVPVVEFLLSPSARFITGQEIVVDGGFSA